MTTDVSLFIALICCWLVLVLVVFLPTLQGLNPLAKLGGIIMSVLDEAISRFTRFTQGVLEQLKGAKADNDAQTAKIAELQAALAAVTADDETDKAKIAELQAEIAGLQESVAAQINAAVDALENPPAAEEPVVETPVVVEPVVEPVVEETPVQE